MARCWWGSWDTPPYSLRVRRGAVTVDADGVKWRSPTMADGTAGYIERPYCGYKRTWFWGRYVRKFYAEPAVVSYGQGALATGLMGDGCEVPQGRDSAAFQTFYSIARLDTEWAWQAAMRRRTRGAVEG